MVYEAPSVIIAAGGFEACRSKQAKYLGVGADLYTIRGNPYNTGEAIEAGLDIGAKAEGNWSDIHATVIDIESDFEGANGKTNVVGYNYGIVVNTRGERFIDEGSDRFEQGYVLMKQLHQQPDRTGFVLADDKLVKYVDSLGPSEPIKFDTLQDLAEGMDLPPGTLIETVDSYNDA